MVVHCLFEQSGTFKNEFKKLGIEAYDYDIENKFGQTDYQIDLFNEIQKGYNNESSIFDNINEDDLIMAFFPCVRFSANTVLMMGADYYNSRNYSNTEKLELSMRYNKEQSELYQLICKMFILVYRKNLKMIVENPATQPHYLSWYFPIKSTFTDNDRTTRGDYFKKPTQYWFVNCKPANNFIFGVLNKSNKSLIDNKHTVKGIKRSLIHEDYAQRFIKEFILKEEQK